MKSVAGVCHSLSICAVRPMGHNSDSSQARFDGGEHFSGHVELPAPSLDPCGFEDYALDEPTSDDDEDLIPSDSEMSNSELSGGNLFVVDGRGGMVICVNVRSVNCWWWLRSWRRPGGRFFGGVSFARPRLFLVLNTGGSVRSCIDVVILAGCWGQV